jgi:hypothetical protein
MESVLFKLNGGVLPAKYGTEPPVDVLALATTGRPGPGHPGRLGSRKEPELLFGFRIFVA